MSGIFSASVKRLISKLLGAGGAALVGFSQDGIGAATRTVQGKLREQISITDFGCVGDGATDNTVALEKVAAYLRTFVGNARMPKVVVPVGTYCYATSPNWGIQGLTMEAEGGAVFKHTGAGNAFICDAGDVSAGISRVQVRGNLRVSGNANTTNAIYIRAVHHSFFEMSGRDCTVAVIAMYFAVCNEYRVKFTGAFEPAVNPVPVTGILCEKRGASEQTSACTFYNPIMEGVSGYGINLAAAVQNTFIGGTSEGNYGGITVSAESTWNNFVGLDMEANSLDINCLGTKNTFENCLATTAVTVNGARNRFIGGTYNAITVAAPRNVFADLDVSNAGGAFTDNSASTVKRNLFNVTTLAPLVDASTVPRKALIMDGPTGNTTLIASDDQVSGGSANDVSFYHYGTGKARFWANGQVRIQFDGNGVGFYGAAPIAQPNVTGSRGGNAALASLITQLAALGLVANGTTA